MADQSGTIHSNAGNHERTISYDKRGNVIKLVDSSGINVESEYNDNHRIIHFKDHISGYEFWNTYSDDGDLLYYKNSYGAEYHNTTSTLQNTPTTI